MWLLLIEYKILSVFQRQYGKMCINYFPKTLKLNVIVMYQNEIFSLLSVKNIIKMNVTFLVWSPENIKLHRGLNNLSMEKH